MSEASLPFNEKIYPTNAKISSGKKLQQEWEKSIKNPEEFWAEKRLHPLCFSPKGTVCGLSAFHLALAQVLNEAYAKKNLIYLQQNQQ